MGPPVPDGVVEMTVDTGSPDRRARSPEQLEGRVSNKANLEILVAGSLPMGHGPTLARSVSHGSVVRTETTGAEKTKELQSRGMSTAASCSLTPAQVSPRSP